MKYKLSVLVPILCITLSILMLSGCATKWDVALNDGYNGAEVNGQDRSADIMWGKTEALKVVAECPGCTKTEAILLKVIVSGDISRMVAPEFHVKAPTLNTDNVGHVARTIQLGIPIVSMMRVATTSTESGGDTSVNATGENSSIVISDSLGKTTTHNNTMGDESTASTSIEMDQSDQSDTPSNAGDSGYDFDLYWDGEEWQDR